MTFINERTVSDWNSDVVGLASYIGQIEETQTSCWISKIRDIMLRIESIYNSQHNKRRKSTKHATPWASIGRHGKGIKASAARRLILQASRSRLWKASMQLTPMLTSSRHSTSMSPSRLGFCRCIVRACQSCGISSVSISQANCLAESYGRTKTDTWCINPFGPIGSILYSWYSGHWVRRKFSIMGGGCKGSDIGALQTHDRNRHLRRLVAADFSLGGLGGISTSSTGLYYTEIGIGTPAMEYYVQVDTGSSAFWVNCIPCKQCPRKSDILKKLTLYDPRSSVSSKVVKCDDMFCTSPDRDVQPECNTSLLCPFIATYADGGSTIGAFVTDLVHYNQLSGNGLTQSTNTSLTFGCGLQQSGSLNTPELAVDGIIGFANSNNTMLSQLAAAGKTKKIFSHCLDSRNGGGIFAIGEVVEPKVKTTPLVQNSWILYLVNLKMIDVGGTTLQLPANIFETAEMKGTFIDSGTTLAYLPEIVYKELMLAVFAKHPDITLHDTDNLECFNFLDSVDDRFPKISLQFENDLALDVYPHDYLLEYEGKQYCFGFQDAAKQDDDMVISNKLVVYDMEKIVIGWTEYNCGERGCEGCMTVERFL
uniref:Peptidase A1 domain-containing protein n=1 Tax=Oryza rufipogon TaxID=4529 RepID=A0A0E0P7C2_ORYRU